MFMDQKTHKHVHSSPNQSTDSVKPKLHNFFVFLKTGKCIKSIYTYRRAKGLKQPRQLLRKKKKSICHQRHYYATITEAVWYLREVNRSMKRGKKLTHRCISSYTAVTSLITKIHYGAVAQTVFLINSTGFLNGEKLFLTPTSHHITKGKKKFITSGEANISLKGLSKKEKISDIWSLKIKIFYLSKVNIYRAEDMYNTQSLQNKKLLTI